MKCPSPSVARLMAVVAIVAANLAVARVCFRYCPPLLLGVGLVVPALQVAGGYLAWGRGRARAFCAGFLAVGLLATASFVGAVVTGPNIGIVRDPVTGKVSEVEVPGSSLWAGWSSYSEAASRVLDDRLPADLPPPIVRAVLIVTSPQWLAALIGGLLAHLVIGRFGRRPAEATLAPFEA